MRLGRKRNGRFLLFLLSFLFVTGGSFLGIQFVTKTGIFAPPGVVYYDESLEESELTLLKSVFTDEVVLKKDVKISAQNSYTKPEAAIGTYLVDILVPVTDFYESRSDISEFTDSEYSFISINDLKFDQKLLTIDGKYYLDDFNQGAVFRTVSFESPLFEQEIQPRVEELFATKSFPSEETVLTMAQTGVTALSRGMNQKLRSVENGEYFAEKIGGFLSSFDLTHTSNESSFTNAASSSNICSDPKFKQTLNSIGLDIVELTGNHNQDCGNEAAIQTIDYYEDTNIKTVGGGRNATEAAVPLEINEKGTKITFLAYNLSTGGATHGNTPGANQYYEEAAANEIQTAKERGDFVLVDIQYYECNAYASEYEDTTCDYANSSAGDQIGFFRHLIDLGADMVVGTSAHQPQTFELYEKGVIYYGLGNLFFDQVWWPGTTRSLILAHYFYKDRLMQTKLVPTVYDKDMQTTIMDEETRRWFLNRLIQVHP